MWMRCRTQKKEESAQLNLIKSMPNRMKLVIKAKSGITIIKYFE